MLKRKKFIKLLGVGSLCLFLLGCSEESFIVQEESSTVILEEEVVLSQDPLLGKNSEQSVAVSEGSNTEEALANVQNENSVVPEENQKIENKIAVHICGAVNQPGVYYLKENQRLYEGIQKAGGFRDDADQDYLNQVLVLEDGMKIIVPTKEETDLIKMQGNNQIEETDAAKGNDSGVNLNSDTYIQSSMAMEEMAVEDGYLQKKDTVEKSKVEEQSGKVDLNTADEALLCTLPGIGESRAKSIIAYRKEHGPFQKTEDVMKVSGIKEAAFEKIKNYVTVSK